MTMERQRKFRSKFDKVMHEKGITAVELSEKPGLEIPETPNKVEQPKITKVAKKTKVEEKVKKLANTGLKNDDLTLLVVLMMAAALVIKREKVS